VRNSGLQILARARHYTCTTLFPVLLRDGFNIKQHRHIDPKHNRKCARLNREYDGRAQPQKQPLLPTPRHNRYRGDHPSNLHVCVTPLHKRFGTGRQHPHVRNAASQILARARHCTCTTLLPILLRDGLNIKQHRNIDPIKIESVPDSIKKYDEHAQPQTQPLLPIPHHNHYRGGRSNIAATCTCVTPLHKRFGTRKKNATSSTHVQLQHPHVQLRLANTSTNTALHVYNSTANTPTRQHNIKQHRNIDSKQTTKLQDSIQKYNKHAQPQKQPLLPIPRHNHYRDDHI
jgi:hypothetical protein